MFFLILSFIFVLLQDGSSFFMFTYVCKTKILHDAYFKILYTHAKKFAKLWYVVGIFYMYFFCVWIPIYIYFCAFFSTSDFFSAARISFCHANLKGLEQDLLAHTLHPNDTHDLATRFFFIFFQNVVFTLSITAETMFMKTFLLYLDDVILDSLHFWQ